MIMSEPLPYGWVMEVDPIHNHPYYVDTKATPPRSIWTHPYEDEQFLNEHPDVREKVGRRHDSVGGNELEPPAGHHSDGGQASQRANVAGPSSKPNVSSAKKRGMFGKLKDKAIGTKEEREAEKQRNAEMHRRLEQQRQEQMEAQRQQQMAAGYYGGYYGGQPMYGSPAGNPYQPNAGRRGGMGGMALPLLGGLAGGLLLGDILDGGFGGGDFGGGDFGGGDFGGGF